MKSLLKVVAASCLLLGTASLALGQTMLFANFTQDTAADKSFRFTNASGFFTEHTVTAATSIPVNFFFQQPTSTGPINTLLAANLTITSSINGAANIGGSNAFQKLNNVTMTFLGTGALAGQNLLTVFASTGTLGGTFPGSTTGLSETDPGAGQVVNYSSDFLNFSSSNQRNYSLALNNLDPGFSNAGGFITNFTSNATGQFAANGFVPEPSSLFLIALGISVFIIKRKNRI